MIERRIYARKMLLQPSDLDEKQEKIKSSKELSQEVENLLNQFFNEKNNLSDMLSNTDPIYHPAIANKLIEEVYLSEHLGDYHADSNREEIQRYLAKIRAKLLSVSYNFDIIKNEQYINSMSKIG